MQKTPLTSYRVEVGSQHVAEPTPAEEGTMPDPVQQLFQQQQMLAQGQLAQQEVLNQILNQLAGRRDAESSQIGTGPTPTSTTELFSQQPMSTSKPKHVLLHVQEYDDEDRNQYL